MSEPKSPQVLALTGYAGAGKDCFAELIKDAFTAIGKSAAIVSSGDLIRQYVRDHNLGDPGDRAVLRRIVDEVGRTHGYTYWLERSIEKAGQEGIEILLYPGLRQTIEVDFLHQRGDKIMAIDVPIERRYAWAQERARPGDDVSFAVFRANEEAERAGTAQQIDAVMGNADVKIINNGTIEQLKAVADAVVADFPSHIANLYDAMENAA